ncbi:MAG: protocatechuate 3,4-dioxygenase, beta subunit [Acidobacteriota bacterium]|jgi:protocatechuate 3,4-dioxygenase beta subunit|nr:protocatechuate 3,4-dioxygenase, beta subunit [Acidobacteriota bacterium]
MKEQNLNELNRRQFIKRVAVVAVALPALPLGFAALRDSEATSRAAAAPAQEWAGAADGPANPSWKTKMVAGSEPGEPLLISGTIFQPDGVTPAKGITLYVYHTDARGYYTNEDPGRQAQKPRLRGWMRTGEDGRYEFRTIRPGAYPGRKAAQHIHATLSGTGYPEYWIDSYFFEGDPYLTAEHRATLGGRGGFQPVITLKRDEQGVLRGIRDIKLQHI